MPRGSASGCLFFQEDEVDLGAGEKSEGQNGGADAVGDDNGSSGLFINTLFIAVFMAMDQP